VFQYVVCIRGLTYGWWFALYVFGGAVPFVELLRKRLREILEDRLGGDNSRLTILLGSQLESLPDDRTCCES
jgi:hypothetical protein